MHAQLVELQGRFVLEHVEPAVPRLNGGEPEASGLPVDDPAQVPSGPKQVPGVELAVHKADIAVEDRPMEDLEAVSSHSVGRVAHPGGS